MPGGLTFKVDLSRFTPLLWRYAALSSHTPAYVVNKKGYYVSRRAIWYTHKADPAKVREELGEHKAQMLIKTKRGRWSHSKKNIKSVFDVGAGKEGAPLLALVVQAQRKRAGLASPWKGKSRLAGAAAMLDELRKVSGARLRSIAFIKSGFIEARDIFKRLVGGGGKSGLPPSEGAAIGGPKRVGPSSKGGATPAHDGWNARATLWNSADARHDRRASLFKYAEPGLQRAIDEEMASTEKEVEDRLRKDAKACGIRVH
jgi:hypothetical protein